MYQTLNNIIGIFLLSFGILLTLFFIGYGITAIFIPEKLRKDSFWLIPWFGIILITTLSVSLNLGRISMYQGKYVIIFFALFMLLYSIFIKKRIKLFSKELLILGILFLICFVINIYPLVSRARFPTSISFGNFDVLTYSNVGDFLINHTVFEGQGLVHFKPSIWSVGDFVHSSYRWGSPLLLSFFSSLFNLRSYQVFSILITVVFSLTFPLLYILAKLAYTKNKYVMMILVFITFSMNSTILYMLYHVFFGQFLLIGLYALVTILVYAYVPEPKDKKYTINSYDFLIGLVISSISNIYPEGLLFIIGPTLLLFGINFLIAKKEKLFYLLSGIKILAIALIINPYTFGTSIRYNLKLFASTIGVTTIGWENIRNASPVEILGFYNLYYSKALLPFVSLLIGLIIGAVFLLGILKIKNKLLFVINLLMIGSLLIVYKFVSPNFFAFHRAITYSVFIFAVLFSIGINYLFSLFKNKLAKIIILIFFLLLASKSMHRTFEMFYFNNKIIDRKLASLEDLNSNKKITQQFYTSDVYLGEYDLWKRVWQEYFLTDKSMVSLQNYPVEEGRDLSNIKLVLAEKSFLEKNDKKIIFTKIIWENKYYELGKIKPLKVANGLVNY